MEVLGNQMLNRYIHNLKIKRVETYHLYNSTIRVDQLHKEKDVHEKEKRTKLYFNELIKN